MIAFYLVLVAVLLVCSACFSGFENGMIAIRRPRLNHALQQGSGAAALIDRMLRHPSGFLATVLLGNNLVNSLAAIYFDVALNSVYAAWWVSTAGSVVLTGLLLVFGEITPKVWFRQNPYPRSALLIYPMYGFALLAWPFVQALTLFAAWLNRRFPSPNPRGQLNRALMHEEFRLLLGESEAQELIDRQARLLLDRALNYHELRVRDLMVPRARVVTVTGDTTLAEAVRLAARAGRSRLPVANADPATPWLGVFSVYDAVFRVDRSQWDKRTVKDCVRPPVTVSDGARGPRVLALSRVTRMPLLIVLDAQHRQVGIVTPADILRPLFGDLRL